MGGDAKEVERTSPELPKPELKERGKGRKMLK
jgi:hypothetical protein